MCVGERPWGEEWALAHPQKSDDEEVSYKLAMRNLREKGEFKLSEIPVPTTRMRLNKAYESRRSEDQ